MWSAGGAPGSGPPAAWPQRVGADEDPRASSAPSWESSATSGGGLASDPGPSAAAPAAPSSAGQPVAAGQAKAESGHGADPTAATLRATRGGRLPHRADWPWGSRVVAADRVPVAAAPADRDPRLSCSHRRLSWRPRIRGRNLVVIRRRVTRASQTLWAGPGPGVESRGVDDPPGEREDTLGLARSRASAAWRGRIEPKVDRPVARRATTQRRTAP